MRFHDKKFFLKIDLQHSLEDTQVEFFDSKFNLLKIDQNNNIQLELPNKLIIRLVNVETSELTRLYLSGLKFNHDSLLKILEYKICKYKLATLSDLEKFPDQKSTKCDKDGYFIVNLFHRNPFAIHLYTENTINVKL